MHTKRALFIGQTYFDITAPLHGKTMPVGNGKDVFGDYEIGAGGNAVIAALTCARLGFKPEILTTVAPDAIGMWFTQQIELKGIQLHARHVKKSALSIITTNEKQERAIARFRADEPYLNEVPAVDVRGLSILFGDGHQHDALMELIPQCREWGTETWLDGGRLRGVNGKNTFEQLRMMDVVIASEDMRDQMHVSTDDFIRQLLQMGAKFAAVTLGRHGVRWCEKGGDIQTLPAFPVPNEQVIDTGGAGDVFHGAAAYSKLRWPDKSWQQHLLFASAASSVAIQRLGTEAGIPTLEEVQEVLSPRLVAAG